MCGLKKVFIVTLLVFIVIILLLGGKYIKQEQSNIKIDEYNFTQLDNINSVLTSTNKKDYEFNNISEFNVVFDSDIDSIKNCYYLSNSSWVDESEEYIFASSLHSNKYKNKYDENYIIYPKSISDRIKESLCSPYGGFCSTDMDFQGILDVIFESCSDGQ